MKEKASQLEQKPGNQPGNLAAASPNHKGNVSTGRSANSRQPAINIDGLAEEFQDRLRYSQNIVDADSCRNKLSGINGIDSANISVPRINIQLDNNHPQPLVVKMALVSDAQCVLRNWKLIPDDVHVSANRSNTQREQFKKLEAEVDEHNRNHPDIKKAVKCISGTPTMVDDNRNQKQQPYPKN